MQLLCVFVARHLQDPFDHLPYTPHAAVQDKNQQIGAISDFSGIVSLKVKEGKSHLNISYIGYKTDSIDVNIHQDTTIQICLL